MSSTLTVEISTHTQMRGKFNTDNVVSWHNLCSDTTNTNYKLQNYKTMRKTILTILAIVSFSMVSTSLLTSCGGDDPLEEITIDNNETWSEPYHVMGSLPDAVQSYMASNMSDYSLSNTSANMLTYSIGKEDMRGIIYSFSPATNGLLSVIDTELRSNKSNILNKLSERYSHYVDNETGQVYYTDESKSMVIMIQDYDELYCNVTYTNVTK